MMAPIRIMGARVPHSEGRQHGHPEAVVAQADPGVEREGGGGGVRKIVARSEHIVCRPISGQPPTIGPVATPPITDEQYQQLLRLRAGLRRFLRWSEEQAVREGLTGPQHQLLLAVRGHPDRRGPTIGELADYLALKHHSVVGLVDRTVAAGLVARRPDADDHRMVRLQLTAKGGRRLASLSAAHLEELRRLAPEMQTVWQGL